MTTTSTATIEQTSTSLSIEESKRIKDEFDDIIHWDYFEQDDGEPHDEGCQFYIGECDQIARFWLTTSNNKNKQFYCPKHFALILHDIIDAVAHSAYFAELQTPAQRRNMIHTFLVEHGRTGY